MSTRAYPDAPADRAFLTRRDLLRYCAAAAAGMVAGGCAATKVVPGATAPTGVSPDLPPAAQAQIRRDELGNPVTQPSRVETYGHYWEFTDSRFEVQKAVAGFVPPPLKLEVGGLVRRPQVYDAAALSRFGAEERVYRLRCIEAWAMVIAWQGFPLHRLLDDVEPLAAARFVRFVSGIGSDRVPEGRDLAPAPAATAAAGGMADAMTGQAVWPYEEGLRLDEAMHDLTIVATGMYGQPLTVVNGAPLRLVVPWKYGFKSVKALARIELVAEQPITFWTRLAPSEYGFYANVNPAVPHPRWDQVKEARYRGACPEPIVDTLKFNGYEAQVGHLYAGMDLAANF